MRLQTKPVVWVLMFIALLSAPNLASAYYDPSVQRWINRDPLNEPGFEQRRHPLRVPQIAGSPNARSAKLYGFCYNRLPNVIDLLGLDAYADCVKDCDDDQRDRGKKIDSCAAWGTGIGAVGVGTLGALLGAGKGRAISSGLVSAVLGALWGAAIEIGGRAGSSMAWLYCVNHCADSYLPPPVWPSAYPDPF